MVRNLMKNRSCSFSIKSFQPDEISALLEMYSNWVDAYEEDKVTAVVLLDMSATFDLVDKSILIEKL